MALSFIPLSAFSPFSVRLFALLACGFLAGCGSSTPSLQMTPNPINIPQGGSGLLDLKTTSGVDQTVVHGRVDGRPASTWPNVLWGTPTPGASEPILVPKAGGSGQGTQVAIFVPATETLGPHSLEFNVLDANGNTIGTNSVAVNVTAPPPNGLRITSAPASLSVAAGSSTTAVLTLTAFGNFSGVVTVTSDPLPQGLTKILGTSFLPVPANGSNTVTLTIRASGNMGALSTAITVRATQSPTDVAISIPLTVTLPSTGGGGSTYVSDFSKVLKAPDLSNAAYQDTGTQLPTTGGSHMYVSANGTIYLADRNNSRILSFSDFTMPNITSVGTQGSGSLQFKNPNGVTLGPDGKIYVADTGNNRIVRMDDMTGAGFATWQPAGSALNQPECIFVDSANAMYVTDTSNYRILRAASFSSGSFQEIGSYGQGSGRFFFPHGLFVRNGRIYVTDEHRIIAMDDITGTNWQEINDTTAGVGSLVSLRGLFVESNGRITVADRGAMQIKSFADINGTGKIVWPPAGTQTPLEAPFGVFIQ